MRSGKVQYLEGLRGIAAMQVVLLHFVSGFLPGAAQSAWPPLRVLFDGHTAVYVFFLISGAVLTPSFARPGPFVAKLAKRGVRLGIPVAAAALIATLLLAGWPDAHLRAAALTGSAWLAMDSSGAPNLTHLAREIGLDSLLLGYREATLFAPLAEQLPPMELSLDAPFWSLHLELYGSLLVLVLVSLRIRSVWLHRAAVAAAAVLFGTHPMFLFVLGHLLASVTRLHLARSRERAGPGDEPGSRRIGDAAGALLLMLGLALCATKDWHVLEVCRVWLADIELAAAPNLFQFASQMAALLIFAGILLCPPAQALLECRTCRNLGRLSFGIYLLHFPILFTLACLIFIGAHPVLPYAASAAIVFTLFIGITLPSAMLFERWIDRPAIALSRRAGATRLRAA
jgi:peptidoglycan/LPS O-acetylase OafA/YrhL